MKIFYVYEITYLPENKKYIGSRGAKNPKTDLWFKYFTSSKVVRGLIEAYGCNAATWEYRILSEFPTAEEAIQEEDRLLRAIENKKDYLNVNFSAGGSVLKNQSHFKIRNSTSLETLYWPRHLDIPEGFEKHYSFKPPTQKNRFVWINLETKEERRSIEDLSTEGFVIKAKWKDEESKRLLKEKRETHSSIWITDGVTNKKIIVPRDSSVSLEPGWKLGKLAVWDKRITCHKDGKVLRLKSESDIPEGWTRGLGYQAYDSTGMRPINNGISQKNIKDGEEIPEGWVRGKLQKNTNAGKKKVLNILTQKTSLIPLDKIDPKIHILVRP